MSGTDVDSHTNNPQLVPMHSFSRHPTWGILADHEHLTSHPPANRPPENYSWPWRRRRGFAGTPWLYHTATAPSGGAASHQEATVKPWGICGESGPGQALPMSDYPFIWIPRYLHRLLNSSTMPPADSPLLRMDPSARVTAWLNQRPARLSGLHSSPRRLSRWDPKP
jgi:hypothetical protein